MLSFIAKRTSSWPSFVLLLTVLTVLFTAFFFFLHYLGNRIPYDLALQRFQALETDLARKEYARGYSSTFENCQLYNSVLRGAESASGTEGHALNYAVLLQAYDVQDCRPVYDAISDDDPQSETLQHITFLKTRHWWGNKAVLAIGLRFFSLAQFRQVVEFATYLSYGFLLVALAMLASRAALVAVPVVVFGVFFSGIKYFSDVSSGVPYLWALLATAILSLLMRWQSDGPGGPLMVQRIGFIPAGFCFVAGMVSSFLFFFEIHWICMIVLVALVAWFGSLDRNARDRAKRAGLFVAFYAVGFVACFVLGQIVKMVVLELPVGPTFKGNIDRVGVLQILLGGVDNVAQSLNDGLNPPLINGWSLFWTIGMGRVATGEALSLLSLAALIIAVLIAVFRGCQRGHWDLLWDILLILTLMVFVYLSLLISNDILGKISRVLFINYGLMWSCLLLAVMKVGWRLNVVIGGFIIGLSLGWLWVQSGRVDDLRSVYDQLKDENIIIQDHFTVYLDRGYRYLVYVRDECSAEDTTPEFRIRMSSAGVDDTANRQPVDYLKTFYFEDYGVKFEGKCVAQIPILEHEIDNIRTGQDIQKWPDAVSYSLVSNSYNVWMSSYSGRIASYSADYDSIADDEPLFRDSFDVYLSEDYGSLVYVKEPCNPAEDAFFRDSEYQTSTHGFFLHIFPVDRDDLAEHRRQNGFENWDFRYSTHGVLADGRCVTKVALPEYDIANVRTGQYIRDGEQYINLWERTSSPFGKLSPYSVEYDSIAGTEPLFRYVFDVYFSKSSNSLVYVKERCRICDVEPRFSLHIFPVDRDDLAEDRRQNGFENRDFMFSTDGVLADGRCVTKVALPEYDIANIRTGQYIRDGDQDVNLWSYQSALQETKPTPLTN